MYELLDNALESVYLRRRASGTPSSYIPQVVLLLDLERNILRVVDNGRSLTYGELVMWGQLGTSDHQKHGDSASGFFPVRYSRFGVGSKGAGKALLGEGGELSMARVEGGPRGSGTKAQADDADREGGRPAIAVPAPRLLTPLHRPPLSTRSTHTLCCAHTLADDGGG